MSNKTIVIILTAITAIMHIALGIGDLGSSLGVLFVLNGLGYFALLGGLYFISQFAAYRSLIRYALMGFALVTIAAYFVVNDNPIGTGLVNKVIELALVVSLWLGRGSES